ncbi:MAG: quinolinate synthase NadA [Fibrobacterales bacterium]
MTAEELYNRLKHVKVGAHTCTFDLQKCEEILPLINEINVLKKEKNAVILAHSYVAPEIVYGVADYTGDSYGLSKDAMNTKADTIVFAAVKFMGETAKLLSPEKNVLIPGRDSGCTLADAITGEQVRALRAEYPDYAFICYINTTAEVKAACDVSVTSSNVYDIVECYPNDKIVFVPDLLMGQNIIAEMKERGVNKEIVLYDGNCYAHKEYDTDMIDFLKSKHDGLTVVSHPECTLEVTSKSDFVGSTGQMMDYIKESDENDFLLLTECGLSSRLQIENPEKNFIGTCNFCKYMKSNTLEDIIRVLKNPEPSDRVELDASVIVDAKACIEKMFEYAEAGAPAAPCE